MSVTETPTGILTFLIADVRGYTSFTQAHGDEGAARLADKFAEIAREGVEMHGGEVTELRGDEALAVFTSPRAAVRAAVDLQMVFADETVVDPALPLTVGIGIDAGEAVAVQGGYRGGALNLAARLCSRAQAGEILVSQGIAHLTRAVDGIAMEQAGEAEVKGLSEPVQVFRVSAPRTPLTAPVGRAELPVALAAVTPIVGRDAEVRRLRWLWRIARRGAAAEVAVVQGPAGIGKTRLVAEVAATVAAGGGECSYLSFAGPEPDLLALAPADPDRARLLVLDDLDAASAESVSTLAEIVAVGRTGACLTLLVLDDEAATTEQLTAVRRLVADDLHIIRPRPLHLDEMLRVAGYYLGALAESIPAEILTSTGGVPRKLHEQVSEWAHAHASQRLGALATAAASGRSDLRSVESDLAGTVIDLQQVREQATLFGLGPGRRAPAPTTSPYRGLSSFDVGDADVFFGRERLVADLISRLAGANLLAVVGASGSGKSSAVRAGLVPALASGVLPGSEAWHVVVMRPGEHPMRALDRALWRSLPKPLTERLGDDVDLAAVQDVLAGGERLVVVVDQLEEVFTHCHDEDERARFLAALARAAATEESRVAVVVTIRADYYGRCAADADLAALLADNQVLVGPMTAEEYRRAIVQPALRVGATVEPDLVDDLVAEVLGEPGALPLLSTTLVELWEQRDGRTLRRASYLATGGVRGAVARLADDVYDGFDEAQQRVARGVLLRLAGPGIGDAVVRRRVPLSEFDADSDETVRGVLDVLANRRLVTVSDGTVEVAHEALLREWPRLQEWLEEDREGRRLRAHLAVAAQEWSARERDEGELYRGARLSAALDWTTTHTAELNEAERDFITASRTASQAELTRQQRQNRRLRGLLVGVVGVLVLALVAGGLALVSRRSAQHAARMALARQLGAEAVSEPRIDQAMLLARQAVLLDNSDATAGTLLATLLRTPAVEGTFTEPIQYRPQQIAVAPDGRTLAVRDNGSNLRFYDTRTHRALPTVLHGADLSMTYAGPHLCVFSFPTDSDPVLHVYDAHTLRLQRTLTLSKLWLTKPTGDNNLFFADPAGRRLFFAYAKADPATGADLGAEIESWDLATGAHTAPRSLPAVGMNIAGVRPDGKVVAVTDNAALTLSPSLRVVRRQPVTVGHGFGALSPDGRRAAFVSAPIGGVPAETFHLVDLRNGQRVPAQGAHTAGIQAVGFSPTGRVVLTTADDGTVDVWDPASGALQQTFLGHTGRVLGLAFSSDGRTAYTCGLDGGIFAWDLGTASRFGRPFRYSSDPLPPGTSRPPFAVSPDGRSFVVRSGVGKVSVESLATLATTATGALSGGRDVSALAWSRSGMLAVGADRPGAATARNLELWSASGTPHVVRSLSGVTGEARALAFSPDGSRVAATTLIQTDPNAAPTGMFGVWDVATGRLLASRKDPGPGWSVAWSADGHRLAAGFDSDHVFVMSPSGRLEQTIDTGNAGAPVSLAFLPDGRLVTGDWSGIVQHWDVATGHQVTRPVLTEPGPVADIAVAPGGRRLALAAGSSGALKIWDDRSLQQFGATFPGGASAWGSLAYTPDGSNVIVVYDDGSAAVWPVALGAWMDHACAVAGRNFTHEEWNRFVPGHGYERTCPAYPAG